MDTVFVSPELQPVANCGLNLKNRVVRAPMTRSLSEEDSVPPDYAAEYYAQGRASPMPYTCGGDSTGYSDRTGTREQVLNDESANHVYESRIKESAA
jgi:2,4-dienoyl-CoA reductase-like NADH-dependent reductase (Old Yellow Enzyme family)